MRDIAGAAVGTVGSGLNQEQRKRVTIGVELASKPELLMFLDEPTSGLDSGAAFNIVRFLRKLADAGQAILCTIHQPSSVLFEHFDQLLLLKSGGRTVYFGELGKDSRTLLDYLEKNGSKKCPPKENPAEFMLEAIGAGDPNYKGKDWGDVWASSPENEKLSQEIQEIISNRRNASTNDQTQDDREYAMPLTTQLYTVVHRSFVAMWRDPPYVIGMFMLHIFTGLFNSFTFWHLGNSQIDMQSRLFSVFMTLTISPPLIQQLQPRFLNLRSLYEAREGKAKIYSWVAFVLGAILSEIPYRIVAGTIYWCCWYWATWFPRDTYTSASVYVYVILFELYYLGFGQMIAAFSPNELLASLLVPLFFTFSKFAACLFERRLMLRSRLLLWCCCALRGLTILLAELDVLVDSIQISIGRLLGSLVKWCSYQMRIYRACHLSATPRPRLPVLRWWFRPAVRWVCGDPAEWRLWVLSVLFGYKLRSQLQRLPQIYLARLRHYV